MVAHALIYWPNVGPSLPQPPNLTSLRKLQYTSARTNVMHASIVAQATLFGVLHTFERGWGDGGGPKSLSGTNPDVADPTSMD